MSLIMFYHVLITSSKRGDFLIAFFNCMFLVSIQNALCHTKEGLKMRHQQGRRRLK